MTMLSEGFNSRVYDIQIHRPTDLVPREVRLGRLDYTPEALGLATVIRAIHQRTGRDIGAEDMAKCIATQGNTFYTVRDPFSEYQPGYACVSPLIPKQGVLHILELEAGAGVDITPYASLAYRDLSRSGIRAAAATAVHAVLSDQKWQGVVQIDARHHTSEGRDPRFFEDDLGMQIVGEWGPGAYAIGSASDMLPRIEATYAL